MSSLQCESAADSALYCGDEIVSKNECPVLPVEICQDDSCAWCGSSDKCTVANNTNSLSDLVGDVCQEDDVGSPIVFEGSNSHSQNGKGADILLRSGNGTSSVGGWGGDIQLSSGNGAGVPTSGGRAGKGGSISLEAGSSDGGHGGNIQLTAGSTEDALSRGGDVILASGSSRGKTSGRIIISSSSTTDNGDTSDEDSSQTSTGGLSI
jgi:hypothetical protein